MTQMESGPYDGNALARAPVRGVRGGGDAAAAGVAAAGSPRPSLRSSSTGPTRGCRPLPRLLGRPAARRPHAGRGLARPRRYHRAPVHRPDLDDPGEPLTLPGVTTSGLSGASVADVLLGIILFGMVIGAAAQLIVQRRGVTINWPRAFAAGWIGWFVGGLLVSLLSGDGLALRPSGIIGSLVGAIIVTAIWQSIEARRTPPADPRVGMRGLLSGRCRYACCFAGSRRTAGGGTAPGSRSSCPARCSAECRGCGASWRCSGGSSCLHDPS